jgi:hypothetical protein
MVFISRRKHYPLTYIQNSNKERLLLWYTENFRRQYHFVYKDRKPLFLAAGNECGLQVTNNCPCCTSRIIQMLTDYSELMAWYRVLFEQLAFIQYPFNTTMQQDARFKENYRFIQMFRILLWP